MRRGRIGRRLWTADAWTERRGRRRCERLVLMWVKLNCGLMH